MKRPNHPVLLSGLVAGLVTAAVLVLILRRRSAPVVDIDG